MNLKRKITHSLCTYLLLILGLLDDGLAISDLSPKDTEDVKTAICKIFREYNLSITIQANQNVVNFLDVQLDLVNDIYKAYTKENDKPEYVHRMSNHPPGIIKNIPISINRRLNNISANKEVFYEKANIYQTELNAKGYQHKLEYDPNMQVNGTRRNRKRNIAWFNPPYSRNVKTNVGAKFLRIISQLFPANHSLYKILNKNTIKISYRCMPNLQNCIDKHNAHVLSSDQDNVEPRCNCTANRKASCPIPRKCTTTSVVYRASVRRHDNCVVDNYTGLTGTC